MTDDPVTDVQPEGGDAVPADELPPSPDRPDSPIVDDDDGELEGGQ